MKIMNEREMYNNASNMIHEDNYKIINCVLCDKEMKTVHDTNCAFPLARLQSAKEAFQNQKKYRSCNDCENDVMNARHDLVDYSKESLKSVSLEDAVHMNLGSIYTLATSQKRFAELGQDFYKTDLGKGYAKKNNDKLSLNSHTICLGGIQ